VTVLSWHEVRRWRRERRADLIARRQALPQQERGRLQPSILAAVERNFAALASATIGVLLADPGRDRRP